MKKFSLDGLDLRKKPVRRTPKPVPGLAMSGGGGNGAYEVGALKYMATMPRFRPGFWIISGTSVGALNTGGLAMYPPHKFPEAAANLEEKWKRYVNKDEDIYDFYWPKYIAGAWRDSLAKSAPLLRLLHNIVNEEAIRKSGIKIRLPSVDIMTGEIVVWDETMPHIIDVGMMGSASFPVVFPLVSYEQYLFTDGGVADIAPLSHAIKAGATSLVAIHTGFSSPLTERPKGAFKAALRVVQLMCDEILRNDLMKVQKRNEQLRIVPEMEKVGYREIPVDIIGPSEDLGDSLDFSAKKRDWQIDLGYEDARKHFEEAT